VDNIIGTIPRYQELTPAAKSIVDMVGVEQSSKEAAK